MKKELFAPADRILKFLFKSGIPISIRTGESPEHKAAYKIEHNCEFTEELGLVSNDLEDYDLIRYTGSNGLYVKLKPEGDNAAKIGIKKYIKKIERNFKLPMKSYIILIFTLIVAVVAAVAAILALTK